MHILGWLFVPFVMIFKNWRQRAFWANAIGSIFAACVLSFYALLLFVTLNGGMVLSSIPSDLRGMESPKSPPRTATRSATPIPPTATPIPPTATPIPPTATPIPPTATTQSQISLAKTAAAKLVISAAKTAAAKRLP